MSGDEIVTKALPTFLPDTTLNVVHQFSSRYGISGEELILEIQGMPNGYISKDNQFTIHRTKSSDKTNRDDFVKRIAFLLFDFRKHPDESSIVFFKRKCDEEYGWCTEPRLAEEVSALWEFFFHCTPTSEIDGCVKNILRSVKETADVRNRVYRLVDGLFFIPDDKQSLYTKLPEGKECFFTLDGAYRTLNSKEHADNIMKHYDEFLAMLNEYRDKGKQFSDFYKDLPRDFEWVETWSCPDVSGSTERYWDMMTAFSTPFHKHLVKRVYLLDGKTRTGKSTFHDVLIFLFGRNNSSQVMITDFDNYHVNNSLAYCCINSPDEEQGGLVPKSACRIFKSLAVKQGVELPVKFKQALWADGQFMSFHPTNSNLEWPDTEAGPCLKRCITIKFYKYLGDKDFGGKTFVDLVFKDRPDELAKFLGHILALATYFSDDSNRFFMSTEVALANEFISTETGSAILYYDYFNMFFDGISSDDFLWSDYINACKNFGWVQQNRDAFRRQFDSLLIQKAVPRYHEGRSMRYKRVPRHASPQILYPGYAITVLNEYKNEKSTPYGDAASMHEDGLSVVATLYNMEQKRREEEEARLAEKENEQLDLGGGKW